MSSHLSSKVKQAPGISNNVELNVTVKRSWMSTRMRRSHWYLGVLVSKLLVDMISLSLSVSLFSRFPTHLFLTRPPYRPLFNFSTGQVNGSLTLCQWAGGFGVLAHTAAVPLPIRQRCRLGDSLSVCVCVHVHERSSKHSLGCSHWVPLLLFMTKIMG